jgi:membrane-bound lytic murein transglycosylase D
VTRGMRSGGLPVALRLAPILALVLAGGCQRVGLGPAPGEAPAPLEPRVTVTAPEAEMPAPAPVRGAAIPAIEVDAGLDPILHSVVSQDPRLEERIEFWVDFWSTRGSGHFQVYLERMAIYEAWVEAELDARGLPRSLKYLPIVESGYHEIIASRVGATGLWQLMAPTARELGLTVGALVDDRRDPLASTRAALDYLETMHGMFGSWFLALAAYNAGPGRIRGIVTRHAPGQDPLTDLDYLELRPHLPAETREFVPRFFAAARIARDPERYGFERHAPHAVLAWEEVMVPDATSLDVVAWAAGVPEDEVRALNRHYLRGFTPNGEPRVVRIPTGAGDRFRWAYDLVPPEYRISFLEHAVARGETLGGIAGRYGVRLAELQAANPGVDARRLQIGQRLVVPVAGAGGSIATRMAAIEAARFAGSLPVEEEAQAALQPETLDAGPGGPAENGPVTGVGPIPAVEPEADEAGTMRIHRVVRGENLSVIARAHGVSVAELQRWNGLSPSAVLRVGDELAVGNGVRTHTVVRGDTWGALARRYGTTAAELARLNGKTSSDVIRVGETLRIP